MCWVRGGTGQGSETGEMEAGQKMGCRGDM